MPEMKREQRIAVRLSGPLLAEIEAAAAADGRSLSDFVRRELIKLAAERVTLAAVAA